MMLLREISKETNPYVFAIMSGIQFAVGVSIVYNGVRLILKELLPAFKGISRKLIPNAVPAVDCAVFFTYAPTALIIGFLTSFISGILSMFLLALLGFPIILPGLVAHFFTGGTAGIFGNANGGRVGAIVGGLVNGLFITIGAALLLPILGDLGFSNTTFSDADFEVLGIVLGKAIQMFSNYGVYALVAITCLVLIIPSFIPSIKVVNFKEEQD